MSRWAPIVVGQQVPGAQQATATADSYTYGAASEALSQGQAMAAWADLQAKQNVARVSSASLGLPTCPTGFLVSLPNAFGYQTCVNQRNVHIAMKWQQSCNVSEYSEYSSIWFLCSTLPRWFELHHPVALKGYSTSIGEAKKMLLTALRELGMLAPGQWENIKSSIHALTRRIFYNAPDFEQTEQSVENELVNLVAPIYDATVAKGGDVPEWISSQIGLNQRVLSESSSWFAWLALGTIGAAGFYLIAPSAAVATWSVAKGLAVKGASRAYSTGRSWIGKVT